MTIAAKRQNGSVAAANVAANAGRIRASSFLVKVHWTLMIATLKFVGASLKGPFAGQLAGPNVVLCSRKPMSWRSHAKQSTLLRSPLDRYVCFE